MSAAFGPAGKLLTIIPDAVEKFVEVVEDGGGALDGGEQFEQIFLLELGGLRVLPGFLGLFPAAHEVFRGGDELLAVGAGIQALLSSFAAAGAGASSVVVLGSPDGMAPATPPGETFA